MDILNNYIIFKEHKDLNQIIKGFQDKKIITQNNVLNQKNYFNIPESDVVSCKQSQISK